MLGSEAMAAAAQTCTECVTTPAIIVEDLQVSIPLSAASRHPLVYLSVLKVGRSQVGKR